MAKTTNLDENKILHGENGNENGDEAESKILPETNPETENKTLTEETEEVGLNFSTIVSMWKADATKTFKLPEWITNKCIVLKAGCVMIKTNQRFEYLHDVHGLIMRTDWQEVK